VLVAATALVRAPVLSALPVAALAAAPGSAAPAARTLGSAAGVAPLLVAVLMGAVGALGVAPAVASLASLVLAVAVGPAGATAAGLSPATMPVRGASGTISHWVITKSRSTETPCVILDQPVSSAGEDGRLESRIGLRDIQTRALAGPPLDSERPSQAWMGGARERNRIADTLVRAAFAPAGTRAVGTI